MSDAVNKGAALLKMVIDDKDSKAPCRVFQMNDCDWWLARSLEEACCDYTDFTGTDYDVCDDARELTDDELANLTFWDGEDRDAFSQDHWVCECGHKADAGDRWNGWAWEHHHGYPAGHAAMNNIHKRSFAEQLVLRVEEGAASEFFATTEF